MFCKNCGKEIDNDSTFCRYCGQKQESNTTTKSHQTLQKSKSKQVQFGIIAYIILWIIVYIPFTILFYILLAGQI